MKQLTNKAFAFVIPALFICVSLAAQKKLAIIGSSTSDCYGLSNYDSCYVGRLQTYYGSSIAITRLAVSGSSVYKGMPTGYQPPANRSSETPDTAHNITAALQTHPEVVVVNYPSNGYDVFSVAESMYCFRTIKNAANSAGVLCYITSTQPRSDPYPYSTSEIRKIMAEIKDSVLAEFGTYAINFWDGIVNPADSTIITSLGQGDGTHLNPAGHKILADKVIAKDIFSTLLPVTFTRFTAAVKNAETVLTWATAGEENIAGYAVQQSADGINFNTVYQVKPAGNIATGNNYTYTCTGANGKILYYRIAATYTDGKTVLSSVIATQQKTPAFAINKVYLKGPDLMAEVTAVQKETLRLQVVSNSGQVLVQTTALVTTGTSTIAVPLSAAVKGVYFLRISGNVSGLQTKSFVKEW